MSDFVRKPLEEKLNRRNPMTRIERLEAQAGARPSEEVGNLDEISNNFAAAQATGNKITMLARDGDNDDDFIEWVTDDNNDQVARIVSQYNPGGSGYSGLRIYAYGRTLPFATGQILLTVQDADGNPSTDNVSLSIDANGDITFDMGHGAENGGVVTLHTYVQNGVVPNASDTVLEVHRDNTTTDATATGFGAEISIRADDDTNNQQALGAFGGKWSDPTGGSERALMFVKTRQDSNLYESTLPAAGWQPFAYQWGVQNGQNYSAASLSLPANGGCIAIPIQVSAPMLLESVSAWNANTSLQRTWNWGLYEQYTNTGDSSENTLTRKALGTAETFTPGAQSLRTSTASGGPIYIPPGWYWLVIQCQHATNGFALGTIASVTNMGNTAQTKTITNPMGSTLDFVAATWTASTALFGVRLNGRVFGQTIAF